jgi:hypothetical protein
MTGPVVPVELSPDMERYRMRASKRVRKLREEELLTWSDNIGSGMAKALTLYFRDSNSEALYAYVDGAIALQVIALELYARREI